MKTIVGALLCLSDTTRPDLATITSILIQHTYHATKQHIRAANYAIRYIKETKNHGIRFPSKINTSMSVFLKFPSDPFKLLPLYDTNWEG